MSVRPKDHQRPNHTRAARLAIAAIALVFSSGIPTRAPAQGETTECDRLTANGNDPFSPLRHTGAVAFRDIDAPRAIDACKRDLAADPDNGRLKLNLGRAYNKAEDYDRSLRYTREAADAGYAYAFHVMALHYLWGEGVKKNHDEEVKYLRLGVDYKVPVSHLRLGEIELDKGVPRARLPEAERLIGFARTKGADATLQLARLNVARAERVLYDQLLGVPADAEPVVIATQLSALDLRVYRNYLLSARDLYADYFRQNGNREHRPALDRIENLLRRITDEEIARKVARETDR